MQIKENSRKEIEARISTMGDYVKIDYLGRCLKLNLDFDTRKFVLNKLAVLYEGRGLFADSAKLMNASAEINTTYQGKVSDFMKGAEMFVKTGNFDDAEISINKALSCANDNQKVDIKIKRKNLFKAQAKDYLKKDKRTYAMKAYEKLLSIDLTQEEKREVQSTLLMLYEKLGKVREFYSLKNSM